MNNPIEIKEIRSRTGLSQSKFGLMFGIPVSNIQNWEQHATTPPSYIPDMLNRILDLTDEVERLKQQLDAQQNT